MLHRIRLTIYDVLVDVEVDKTLERRLAIALMILIVANGVAVMLETVKFLEQRYSAIFYGFEIFSVGIFSVEYLLRLWVATLDPKYRNPIKGRLRYMVSPMALIDLAAILPFYLPLAVTVDLRVLRLLRLFRLFRLFKMTRYVESLRRFHRVFAAKKEELLITALMIFILLVFASSAMYAVENEAQPDKFPNIPETLWWGVVTLTTIGYGDVYPVTPAGKVIGGVIAFLGIGLFALPAGILASGFTEELRKHK
jgi:voltage-gated potassium channel